LCESRGGSIGGFLSAWGKPGNEETVPATMLPPFALLWRGIVKEFDDLGLLFGDAVMN
jgi:hypothetical protein